MGQRLQDTDAYILMQFGQEMRPLHASTEWNGPAIKAAASPFLARLRDNGHEQQDAVRLLSQVWNSMGEQRVAEATP